MITEDYISFETAKLLKKKGFTENCLMRYNKVGDLVEEAYKFNWNFQTIDYSAPTLQMVMKWLREVHKIHIQIWILEEKGYWFGIEKILNAQYKHKSLYSTGLEDIYFETYEQTIEAAIKYCLENLI